MFERAQNTPVMKGNQSFSKSTSNENAGKICIDPIFEIDHNPAGIYLLKANNSSKRTV